jgi:hypothetical protein
VNRFRQAAKPGDQGIVIDTHLVRERPPRGLDEEHAGDDQADIPFRQIPVPVHNCVRHFTMFGRHALHGGRMHEAILYGKPVQSELLEKD